MSNPFGLGTTAFAVHTDTSHITNKKSKPTDIHSKQNLPKRAALGVITNQASRVQCQRTTKQGQGNDQSFGFNGKENASLKQTKPLLSESTTQPQKFSIHVDSANKENHVKPARSKAPARPTLKHKKASQSSVLYNGLQGDSVLIDSPMLLDKSLDLDLCREETAEDRLQEIVTVSEYSHDIYQYLRTSEQRFMPKLGYMKKQNDITHNMRSILIDWLVEVAEEYKLHRETLFLAVNFIDRFLSHMGVQRGRLQLVGTACMFLAAKYEEIYPPEVAEFVYITDETYTKDQLLKMEMLILKVLDFNIAAPTANFFAERFLKQFGFADTDKVHFLSMFLVELSLLDADTFHRFKPSEIAASAICLACHTLGLEAWSGDMARASKYPLASLIECVQNLYAAYIRTPTCPQAAIREKYKQLKCKQVSSINPPETLPFTTMLSPPVGSEMIS